MEEKNYKKIIQAIRDLDIEELRKENNEIEGLIHTQYEKYLKENKKRKQLCSFIENMEGLGTSLSVTDYDFEAYRFVPDNPYTLKIKMQKKEYEVEIYLNFKDFKNERHIYKKGVDVDITNFLIDVGEILKIKSEKKQYKEVDKWFTNKDEAENLKIFLHDMNILKNFDWEGNIDYLEEALYDDVMKGIEKYKQDQTEVLGLIYLKNKRL